MYVSMRSLTLGRAFLEDGIQKDSIYHKTWNNQLLFGLQWAISFDYQQILSPSPPKPQPNATKAGGCGRPRVPWKPGPVPSETQSLEDSVHPGWNRHRLLGGFDRRVRIFQPMTGERADHGFSILEETLLAELDHAGNGCG
jgi:hypothetical protein